MDDNSAKRRSSLPAAPESHSRPADGGLDPYFPAIPKAPLIPKDLERMPNPALPGPSLPPESDDVGRPTYDAQRPPPPVASPSQPPLRSAPRPDAPELPSSPEPGAAARRFGLREHWPIALTALLLLLVALRFC